MLDADATLRLLWFRCIDHVPPVGQVRLGDEDWVRCWTDVLGKRAYRGAQEVCGVHRELNSENKGGFMWYTLQQQVSPLLESDSEHTVRHC